MGEVRDISPSVCAISVECDKRGYRLSNDVSWTPFRAIKDRFLNRSLKGRLA